MKELVQLLQAHIYRESYSTFEPDFCSCGVKFVYRHKPVQWARHVAAALSEVSAS